MRRIFRLGDAGPAAQAPDPPMIQTPIRDPSLQSDVLVPLAWGLAVGALGGLWLAGVAAYMGIVPFVPAWLIATGGIALVTMLLKAHVVEEAMYKLEPIIGRDITGDGIIGAPKAKAPSGMAIRGVGQGQAEFDDEELRGKFIKFIQDCYRDGETIERSRLGPDLDRETYELFRNTLIRAGFARWKSSVRHESGWRFNVRRFPSADSVLERAGVELTRSLADLASNAEYWANGGPEQFR